LVTLLISMEAAWLIYRSALKTAAAPGAI
jgi:hypothetical protein